MLGGDWLEHWKAGGDEDHGSIEDNGEVTLPPHKTTRRPWRAR